MYLKGLEHEQSAFQYLKALRFAEAIQMFEQSRQNFDALTEPLENQTRLIALGSTPSEIASAVALCAAPTTGCESARYEVETYRQVRLRPFAIDDHEVSNEAFAQFSRATGYEIDAERRGFSMRAAGVGPVRAPGHHWRSPAGTGSDHLRHPNHPVVHVSFDDASAYCQWSGEHVPDEAQWEYAARGDKSRQFAWGDEWRPDQVRWSRDPAAGPMPGRSFPRAATPEGLHDMAGNVWEWTRTRVERGVILKGGSWLTKDSAGLRAAARLVADPQHGSSDFGFRCVWELEEWP